MIRAAGRPASERLMRGMVSAIWIMIWSLMSMILTIPLGIGQVSAVLFAIATFWFCGASLFLLVRRTLRWISGRQRPAISEPQRVD